MSAPDLSGWWTLEKFLARGVFGEVEPFGPEPGGLLVYDANAGRMAVQVWKHDRPPFTLPMIKPTEAEAFAAVNGFIAYYGRYAVRPGEAKVVHWVEGALAPNMIGTEQVRTYSLRGDQLVLTASDFELAGQPVTLQLQWRRASR